MESPHSMAVENIGLKSTVTNAFLHRRIHSGGFDAVDNR